MLKIALVVLLSATLITLKMNAPANLNNSVTSAEAQTVQAKANETIKQPISSSHENGTPQSQEPSPQPPKVTEPEKKPLTDKQALMQAAGIPEKDWLAVDYIVTKESTWRHDVYNSGGSGAYGLCQSLPANKMASAGADYMSNPVTQLKWCHEYAMNRYKGWHFASAFWSVNRWW